jgi:hypothetical protein
MQLSTIAQIVQIAFWLVAAVLAVLTYRSAKRGLLNTVRTEYMKRVMDRLADVSNELAAEFDPESPRFWTNNRFAEELVGSVHEEYAAVGRETYSTRSQFDGGYRATTEQRRQGAFWERIRTDPFIPRPLRTKIVAHLSNRHDRTGLIYKQKVNEYRKHLAEKSPELEDTAENQTGSTTGSSMKSTVRESVSRKYRSRSQRFVRQFRIISNRLIRTKGPRHRCADQGRLVEHIRCMLSFSSDRVWQFPVCGLTRGCSGLRPAATVDCLHALRVRAEAAEPQGR